MAVQINVAANQAALIQSIQQGVAAYNSRFANQNQINLSINQRGFSQPLGRITGDVKDFNAAMAASNARVIAFGASTAVLGSAIVGFKSLAKSTVEVEKNLTDINRVLELSTKELQEYSSALFDISKKTATSFNEASKALLEFSRQGLSAEETLKRTNDALVLTRIAGMGAEASVEALTATVNGFSDSGITTTQVLNKLVAVEQSFAVSARDLSEGLSRTGQAAQAAGVDIDQLNALITVAQQRTARGGAVIGNALKTIFTRLQRSDTLDQLEAFNIAVRDVQGNTLPAVNILQNFASAYNQLADAQRAQLSEQVAGVYQVNILKAIVGDLNSAQGIYNQALSKGIGATNEAQIANAKLNTTLSALLNQVSTNTQQLASNIGKVTFDPLAKSAADAANSILESLNEVLTGEGIGSDFANGFLKGIRNLLAGPGAIMAFYTLFKLISNSFSYLTQALPQIAGITTQTQNRKNIESAILQIMQQQGPISQALSGQMGNQAAQAQLLLQLARQQTAEYQRQSALAQSLAASLATQGVKVGSSGLQVKTRSLGYVPRQAAVAEQIGALAGGYRPGKVVPSPVGGVMNTAEDVKYVPGFAQPFINPPSTSRAGKLHRANAIKQVGVDPYMYDGFIPNFTIKGIYSREVGEDNDLPVLAGRVFEALLRGDKFLDLTENKVGPDIDRGPYYLKPYPAAEKEAKLSGRAAFRDTNFGKGKPKGNELILPKTAIDDYDERLSKKKEAIIYRAKYTRAELFSKAKNILRREQGKNTNYKNVALSSGFIPNFASYAGTAAIRAAVESGFIDDYKIPGTKSYRFPDGSVASEAQVTTVASRASKGVAGKTGSIKFAGGKDFSAIPITSGKTQLIDAAYESVVQKSIPGLISAHGNNVSFSLPFSGGGNSFVDFFNPAAKSFYEAKGGKWTPSEVSGKFANVRTDLQNQLNKQLQQWKNVLVYNPDFAASGFIPNFARFKSKFGTATLGKTDPIDLEYFSKTLGRKIKASDIVSIEDLTTKGKGSAGGLYGDIASSIKGKGGIFGYALAQDRAVKGNDPLARLKAKYPQIAKRIGLGGETFISGDYGQTVVRANSLQDLIKYQDQILRMVDPAVLTLKSFAGGFIPNFAYKNAVMQLEQNMSGEKAIFSNSPFPHIRNASQPTFSSAIADHGGLGNALSDSMRNQKAAGLMSGGFIPNFASLSSLFPTPPPSWSKKIKAAEAELEKLAKEYAEGKINQDQYNKGILQVSKSAKFLSDKQKQLAAITNQEVSTRKKQLRSEKLSRLGTTLAFAGPMIAGQLEQFAYGNMERTQMTAGQRFGQSALSTGLTSVTTGASIGSAFGPLGTAIGAAAGAALGLAQAFKDTKLSTEEMAKAIDENTQKQISSANNYQTSFQKLRSAIENKDLKGQQIAQNELASVLAGISDPTLKKSLEKAEKPEDFEKITSKARESAAAQTALLTGAEKIKGGGDLSFFDRAEERLGEFVINFVYNFTTGLSKGLEIFSQYMKDSFTSMLTTVGSFFTKMKDGYSKLTDIIADGILVVALELPVIGKAIQKSIGMTPEDVEGVYGSLSENTENFKKNFTTPLASVASKSIQSYFENFTLAGIAFSTLREGRELTEDPERAKLEAQKFITQGGLSALPILGKIFRADRDETELQNLLKQVASEQVSSKREELLRRGVTESLQKAGLDEKEIDTFIRFAEQLSSNGNKVGQMVLYNMNSFVSELEKQVKEGKITAEKAAQLTENFFKLRNEIESSLQQKILQAQKEDIRISGALERVRLRSGERSRKASAYGLPFAAAQTSYIQNLTDIEAKQDQERRKLLSESRKQQIEMIQGVAPGDPLREFNKIIENENLSLEERNRLLLDFVQKEGNVVDANKRSVYEQQIKASQDSLENAKLQAEEEKKTAELNLEYEIKRLKEARSFSTQLKQGFSSMSDEADLILGKLGRDIPNAFADGMTNALMQVAKGTESIGDAFKNVAIDFGQMIMQAVMRAAIGKALGSIAPNLFSQEGGVIKAQNGMYISGGRTGDRNLALLEDGEYVLNRNAVRMMGGPSALNKLNFNMAPRFGGRFQGGGFTMSPQTDNSDFGYTGNLLFNNGAQALDSNIFSAYAFAEDEYFKKVREKAISDYEAAIQKRFLRKQKNAQLISSIVGAAGSLSMGYGMSGIKAGASALTVTGSKGIKMDAGRFDQVIQTMTTSQKGGYIGFNSGGFVPYGSRLNDTIPALLTGGEYVMNNTAVKKYGLGTMNSMNAGAYQNGGSVASSSNATTNNTNNNATNISINIDRSGRAVYGADTSSYKANDIVLSKEMARQINGVVLRTMSNEKRYGGELYKNPLRT